MKIDRALFAITFAVSILCSCATQQDTSDVDRFVDRRDICDHLAGEIPDPPNPERMKEVIDGANKYCPPIRFRFSSAVALADRRSDSVHRLQQS